MKRFFKGTFNRVPNGDFLRRSKTQTNFPEAWHQIGGNHETHWNYKQDPREIPLLEISNTTAIHAGIIQMSEASIRLGNVKEWLIKILLRGDSPNVQAYLRIYPVSAQEDVAKPWEYCFGLETEQQLIKQVISFGSEVKAIRLEIGVFGTGSIHIFKITAYSLSPNRIKRGVKKPAPQINHIKSIQTIGEIIKPIQLAAPIPLKIPVNVQAYVNADVRDLTPVRDKIQIFGSNQVPIATTASGQVQVEICGHEFYESKEDVTVGEVISTTIIRDISELTRCSFAVLNIGKYLANVQAELSPDGVHWIDDGTSREVGPGKLVIISPEKFLRYTRIKLKAENLTRLRIWVQAQN